MQYKITENEEQAYRFRHHNFEGLTTKETAKKMKIAPQTVRTLLKSLKAKAPQLFPILTSRQWLVYWLYSTTGLSQYEIAAYLKTTQSNIWRLLERTKKNGMPFIKPIGFGDIVAYEKGMDDFVIYKF